MSFTSDIGWLFSMHSGGILKACIEMDSRLAKESVISLDTYEGYSHILAADSRTIASIHLRKLSIHACPRSTLKLELGLLLFFLCLALLGLHRSMFGNHIRKSFFLMKPSFRSLLSRLFLIM